MIGQDDVGGRDGLRRRPAQRRSRERVRHILRAAAELLAEAGYPALSTSGIATRAGVSVASIYQFFPNVEGIVGELAAGWRIAFDRVVGRADLDGTPGGLVDAYARFLRETPGFLRVQATTAGQLPWRCDEALAELMRRRLRTLGVPDADLVAPVTGRLIDALVTLAFATDPGGDPALLGEAKRALDGYLAPHSA